MKKVLVTGAAGFIGPSCIDSLIQRGFEVHGISRQQRTPREKLTWHQFDLLNEDSEILLQKIRPTHLLHLAWVTEHGKFWNSNENEIWFSRSLDLLKNFQKFRGQRFVNAGTCAEYTWNSKLCEEGLSPEEPATVYGQFKKRFSDELNRLSAHKELSTANGRIFLLYGPGEPLGRLIPDVTLALLRGQKARCTNGLQVRDFLYVSDVADALVALLDSPLQGSVNLGSGHPLSLKEFVQTLEAKLGFKNQVEFGALPRGPSDPDFLVPSTKRLFEELHWKPKVSLEEGLTLTIDWLRSKLGPEGQTLK